MRLVTLLVITLFGGGCRGGWTPVAHSVPLAFRTAKTLPGGLAWFAGETGAIVATADNGLTWAQQTTGLPQRFLSVDFASPMVGWVCGELGAAAQTTDGGNGWSPAAIAGDDLGLGPPDIVAPIATPDDTHAWAIARWADTTVLYHTSDSGVSWTGVRYTDHGYSSPSTLYGLAFSSNLVGWLIASRYNGSSYIPVMLRTVDAGGHWQAFDAPPTPVNSATDPTWEATLQADTPTSVWLHLRDSVTGTGRLFHLSQAAGAWTWGVSVWNARVSTMAFSGSIGIVVGGQTWQTRDGMATVRADANPGGAFLVADMASPTNGFACGPDGTLYRWTPVRWGDADGNGVVDITDACLIAALAVGRMPPPGVSLIAADTNASGQVTIVDAVDALRKAGGLNR
jgi:photosystem II stability/assembly factor-like uncharacterized protein